MTPIIGLIGNCLLSLCGIPLLVSTMRGTSYTSPWYLAMWLTGAVFAAWFGFLTHVSYIIMAGYAISILFIFAIAMAQYGRKP